MSRLRHCFFAALFAGVLVIPEGGFGDTASPEARILLMLSQSDDAASVGLAADLSKRIEDIGVAVRLTKIEGQDSDPLARMNAAGSSPENKGAIGCFTLVQSTTGTSFHLVLFDSKSEWSVVRRLEEPDTETLIETLAVIIRTALTVFMADLNTPKETIEKQPPAAPTPKPPERPLTATPPPRISRYRLGLGAGYDFSFVAGELTPIHGILLWAAFPLNRFVGVYGSYVISFPSRHENENTSFRVSYHPVRLGVFLRTTWSRFNLVGKAALCINYVSHEIEFSGNDTASLEKSGYLQLSAVPVIETEVSIIDPLRLFFAVGADILLRRPRYLYKREGEIDVIADPWPVTPRVSVGVSWRLFKVDE